MGENKPIDQNELKSRQLGLYNALFPDRVQKKLEAVTEKFLGASPKDSTQAKLLASFGKAVGNLNQDTNSLLALGADSLQAFELGQKSLSGSFEKAAGSDSVA